jgi:hypothetical protein
MLILLILLQSIVLADCLPMRGGESETAAGLLQYEKLVALMSKRASKAAASTTSRVKATTVTQSVNNWIEDVDTVNSFLNVALSLPLGPVLKAGASKALSFAQDEPVNNKYLGQIKGLDSAGVAAAATLDRTFGDVLVQLGNVVDRPASLPVAANAVARINVNR